MFSQCLFIKGAHYLNESIISPASQCVSVERTFSSCHEIKINGKIQIVMQFKVTFMAEQRIWTAYRIGKRQISSTTSP